MSEFARIEENSEIIDLLYHIIAGYDTVKKLQKKIKRKRSTISTQLMFLRENKVVKKQKWNYSPNWVRISVLMSIIISELIEQRIRKKINAKKYFTSDLLNSIVRTYSSLYFQGHEKLSFKEMAEAFLDGLLLADEKRVRKISSKLLRLRTILKEIPTKEEILISNLSKT